MDLAPWMSGPGPEHPGARLQSGTWQGDWHGVPSLSNVRTPSLTVQRRPLQVPSGARSFLPRAPGLGTHAHFADEKTGWERLRPQATK